MFIKDLYLLVLNFDRSVIDFDARSDFILISGQMVSLLTYINNCQILLMASVLEFVTKPVSDCQLYFASLAASFLIVVLSCISSGSHGTTLGCPAQF